MGLFFYFGPATVLSIFKHNCLNTTKATTLPFNCVNSDPFPQRILFLCSIIPLQSANHQEIRWPSKNKSELKRYRDNLGPIDITFKERQ